MRGLWVMCSVEKPIIVMSDKLLKIIEKKIDLFIQPSSVDLGFKISALIKPLKPVDFRLFQVDFGSTL